MSPEDGMLQAALQYGEDGRAVFPVREKRPLTPRGFKDASSDPEVIRGLWSAHPNADVAMATGAISGVVVFDTDSAEGEANFLALCGGVLPVTRMHRTGRGMHYLFNHPGGHVPCRNPLLPHLDVKADGGYVVAPPSRHAATGRRYEVVNPETPIADLPPLLARALFEKTVSGDTSTALDLSTKGTIDEGARNSTLTRIAGKLRGPFGLEIDALRHLLQFYNATLCNPPLEENEVEKIVRSASNWERGNTVIEEINKTFAIVQTGNSVRVLQELNDGEFVLLSKEDFRILLANQHTRVDGGKPRPAADVWLTSPQRREYSRIVFEPGKRRTSGAFNLFKGWPVDPRPGDCSLFLDHLRNNVCQGDEALHRYLISWFAQLFQFPEKKPDTAIVLRGRQGTGKTICGVIVGHLLGRHYTKVATSERVVGKFNVHLSQCLLLQADEAFWAGDKAAEGALKDLITSESMFIERKGVDSVSVANHVRLLVTSNARWVVPAGLEERRFVVIDIGDGKMQDRDYFGALMDQMESGGYEALLHHLQHLDINGFDFGRIPHTKALAEQKLATLSSELKWLVDILVSGVLPGSREIRGVASAGELHTHYIRHAQRTGFSMRSSQTQLGMFLKRMLPGSRRSRARLRNRRGENVMTGTYEFPSLGDCRKQLSEATQHDFRWREHAEDDDQWLLAEDDGSM